MSTVHGREVADIGDIIGLIDPSVIGKMKKVEGINPLLFTNLETRDKSSLNKSIKAQEDVDDFFMRGSDDEEEGEEQEVRKEKKKAKELEIAAARNTKAGLDSPDETEDIDIDRI
jgi:hypothetical protein